MNFRSVADLNRTIVAGLPRLPRDIDLVAGIPRSGLLAGNILALHLNLPLTDIDGLIAGRVLSGGRRLLKSGRSCPPSSAGRVLVIDDSILSGRAMQGTRALIETAGLSQDILYAAVYGTIGNRGLVDFCFEEVERPRIFEWNFMHHEALGKCCVDIDGVLCVDPTAQENDDGPAYCEFLRTARPLWLPTVPVGSFVTCRLEKYRPQTEEWLARHGVKYDSLIMMDYPDKKARQAAGRHGAFKAEVYCSTNATLFVESSHRQAVEIAQLSGKPVLSIEERVVVHPPLHRQIPQIANKARSHLQSRLARLCYKIWPR